MNSVLIQLYQCPGCVSGEGVNCGAYKPADIGCGCGAHVAGTSLAVGGAMMGRLLLGMPKGFDRLGPCNDMGVFLFDSFGEWDEYDWLNVPVWKHLDRHGNTLVRGLQPRINTPFSHVYAGDQRDHFNCYEVTPQNQDGMD